MTISNTMVAVRDKGSMRNATDQAQASESPLDIRQAGIHRLISQRMQEDSLLTSHEPRTHAWAHWNPDSERSQRPDAQSERKANDGEDKQRPGCSQTARLADELPYGKSRSNTACGWEVPSSHAPQQRQTSCCSKGSESPSAITAGAATLLQDSATDCQSDSEALPSLLERPQHAQHALSSPAAPATPVVDERLIAAAPTYARTVMLQPPQQQELAGFSSHAQLAMPFSHLLCLWAIKLVLPHPVTQKVLKVTIPDPPVFEQVRAAEAHLVNGPHNE